MNIISPCMKMKCEENIKCNTLTRKFTTNKQGKFNQNEAMIFQCYTIPFISWNLKINGFKKNTGFYFSLLWTMCTLYCMELDRSEIRNWHVFEIYIVIFGSCHMIVMWLS